MKQLVFCILFLFLISINAQNNPSQTTVVDFERITARVTPDMSDKNITGQVTIDFKILQDTDMVFLDAKNMTITTTDNTLSVEALQDRILIQGDLKQGQTYTVNFGYAVIPKQTVYFVNDQGKSQVWTQGQGKYTSYWLPSIDDINDKIEFDLSIIAPLPILLLQMVN